MTTVINQLEDNVYETTFRGRVFTLIKGSGGWCMWNRSVGGRSNPPKPFGSLWDVEAKYKHWAGITQLVTFSVGLAN